MTTLRLIEQDDNAPKPLTGEQILALVADVIAEHIPSLAFDDPYYGTLSVLGRRGHRRPR